jgi:hypothetical protein
MRMGRRVSWASGKGRKREGVGRLPRLGKKRKKEISF